MADKIVTLKDKNNNNLYPVAGALHADTVITGSIKDNAVTTPKIANSAVTSSKIDWATMTVDRTDDVIWNEAKGLCTLVTQGNRAYLNYQSGTIQAHPNNFVFCTIPSDILPKSTSFASCVVSSNTGAVGHVVVSTSGEVSLGYISSASLSGRVYFQVSWFF